MEDFHCFRNIVDIINSQSAIVKRIQKPLNFNTCLEICSIILSTRHVSIAVLLLLFFCDTCICIELFSFPVIFIGIMQKTTVVIQRKKLLPK